MADELLIEIPDAPTNAKFVVCDATSRFWNTSGTPAFEAYNAANIANYGTAMTRLGSSAWFKGTFPAVAAGLYRVSAFKTAGASLAESDTLAAAGGFRGMWYYHWSGSVLIPLSSLATQASVDTIDDFLDTEIAAIKAKTDNLPADPADASDIAGSFTTINSKLDTIDDFLDTEIAAIKAKTDNLPSDPADASDIASSFSTVNTKLDTIDDFLDTEIAAIKAKTDNLPSDPADASDIAGRFDTLDTSIADLPTNAELSTALAAADDAVLARLGSPAGASVSADIAAIQAKTTNLPPDPADASDIASSFTTVNGKLDTIDDFLDTEVAAIKAKTDNLPTDPADQSLVEAAITAATSGLSTLNAAGVRNAVGLASANLDTQLGDIPTNSELATAIITGLTTALTEGYRATGATGSVRDLLYEIMAGVLDHSITNDVKSIRRINGTAVKTYQLDSATAPTSITELT